MKALGTLFVLGLGPVALAQSWLGDGFVENQGQWDARIRYAGQTLGSRILAVEDGWWLDRVEGDSFGLAERLSVRFTFDTPDQRTSFRIEPSEIRPGLHHFFFGPDPAEWRKDVPWYGAVRYRDVRPGIDVVLRLREGHAAFDVQVAPGADLSSFRLECEGADRLELTAGGDLLVWLGGESLTLTAPRAWSLGRGGQRTEVVSTLVLDGDRGIRLRACSAAGEGLLIDPGLVWSTFVPSVGVSEVAVDSFHRVVIGGSAIDWGFPATAGAFQTTYQGGGEDVFGFS